MKKTYYAFSEIGGSGLFAVKRILKNEAIFRIHGSQIMCHRYTPRFSPVGPNWVAIDKEKWLVPVEKSP